MMINSFTHIKKRLLPLILLLCLFTPHFCYAQDLITDTPTVSAINGRDYYPAVISALKDAKSSIHLVMYLVSVNPYHKDSKVYTLINELIAAKERGLEVKVILDQSINFSGDFSQAPEGKNAWCFKILKEAGVDVKYDTHKTYTHTKAIVIDKERVILGSSNWSEKAFSQNMETNVLISSKELAREILRYFKTIKIDDKASDSNPADIEFVPLSWKFLEDPVLAGRMLTKNDERAFDMYLLLLKDFNGNTGEEIALDYDKTALLLRIDNMTRTGYRRQIIKSLRKLDERYGLIKFEPKYAKDANITLLSYDNSNKPYSVPSDWYFKLPEAFWGHKWYQSLSFPAKYCYLINLAYAGISNSKPWWFASRDVLSKRFHIGKTSISKGMTELRRANLIDVLYDSPEGGSYEDLLAKSYKVMPLYDQDKLRARLSELESTYGASAFKAARKHAGIVFKENDAKVIEEIIHLISSLGPDRVNKAFTIVSKKRPDNPKRSYAYAKGILENMSD